MVARALRIADEMRQLVSPVLRKEPPKLIALKLEGAATERAIENWQSGYNLPSAPNWEALKFHYPEFHAKSLEWAAQKLGVDPHDEMRLLFEVQRLLSARLAGNGGGK
jgi:hypothetical protein